MNTMIFALAAGAACSVSQAQERSVEAATPPTQERFFNTEVRLEAGYAFRADVDGGGDVAVTRSALSARIARTFTPDFSVSLMLSSEISWYDFEDATGLIAGSDKPFGQLVETDIAPGMTYRLNDDWTLLAGIYFRIAGENDADFSDSWTFGTYGGVRYKVSKDLSLTMGIRATERLEEDWLIIPAFAFDWNVNETVRVQLTPNVGGTGVRVSSEITDRWSFLIDAQYQNREFRLNDEAPLASGIVRDSRVTVGLGVLWKPSETIELTARGGVVAWQEFRIDDQDGNQQSEANTDPTPYVYLGGIIRF